MSMKELIDAHRRAHAAFIIVINEQSRLAGEEEVSRACEVDILLARLPAAPDLIHPRACEPSIYGENEDAIEKQMRTIYMDHAVRLHWLDYHAPAIYSQAIGVLDDLLDKNLTHIGPAINAWRKDRQTIAKKEAALEKQWQEANAAETAAAVALLRHPAANSEEEAQRSAYIRETNIINSSADYADALLQSFLTEPAAEYTPNKVYWSLELGQ